MSGYPTQKTWRDYLRIRVRSLMLLISLRGTAVTDAGLHHLRNLVGLLSRNGRALPNGKTYIDMTLKSS
jgi:hypothetical protein